MNFYNFPLQFLYINILFLIISNFTFLDWVIAFDYNKDSRYLELYIRKCDFWSEECLDMTLRLNTKYLTKLIKRILA